MKRKTIDEITDEAYHDAVGGEWTNAKELALASARRAIVLWSRLDRRERRKRK